MCSFLLTSWMLQNLAWINFFMQRRGPDATSVVELPQGFRTVHNLLSLTGAVKTLQPFLKVESSTGRSSRPRSTQTHHEVELARSSSRRESGERRTESAFASV
ncbi:unnamed protein product, partial [Amoebophrya sp. A25]|eukprot:GSA25T00026324001.1